MEAKINNTETRDVISYILVPQNFHAIGNTVTIPFPVDLVAGDIVDVSFTATLKSQNPQEVGYFCRLSYNQGTKTFTFATSLVDEVLPVRVQFDNKKAIFVNLLNGDSGFFESLGNLTIVYHKNFIYVQDVINI